MSLYIMYFGRFVPTFEGNIHPHWLKVWKYSKQRQR